jgi:SPP1 family predicted phage head-tail adaptor
MIPRIASGQLTQRITIQTATQIPDRGGGRAKTWVNSPAIWARVEPMKGDEVVFGMQISSRVTHKITIRYRSGLTTAQRIMHKSQIYNIRSILNDDSRDRKLIILAEQGVAT